MAIPKLGKKIWILIGVFSAIATCAGWFWAKNSYPYLLENPIWQFNKPSDETIIQSLPSVRNIDYRQLRSLLEMQQWEKADQETGRVFAKASDLELFMPMSRQDILNFPCTDLTTIDRLWRKSSSGRFGFSVQQKIVERDRNLSDPERDQQICMQKCSAEIDKISSKSSNSEQDYLNTTACSSRCIAKKINNLISRIPERMGRGDIKSLSKGLKKGLQLPDGYYPSWGIYGESDFSNSLTYTYREFAERSAMCGL
ncbi:hypothetical protein PseudUWO311_02625 [Pseudanabaena sp. UWO311]|uniref:GUN4 domain-containing protein n=1 Tax=Pseudanabaena sp. UWO311 TaxID=2487337 RepID=UPI001158D557|nr:GUN4 domain-containing protein [Pseudanabaena sp. UWO311]TYQ29049.1 hypothetical protein PseudUWO311_02625 [Pseudanabaena sp. UWO311]